MEEKELAVCREHFERVDARLHHLEQAQAGQNLRFSDMAVMNARMHEKLNTLDASLKSLVRALWGISNPVTVVAMLLSVWNTVNDPTTSGLKDSSRALSYDKPGEVRSKSE